MFDFFVVEICVLFFNFVLMGWVSCDGQFVLISQNIVFFLLLGINYGGDGKVFFVLFNFGGCMVMGFG